MKTLKRSNFIKSSNLLFMTLGLVLFSFVINRIYMPYEANSFLIVFINLVFIGSVGLVVRRGDNWSKYLPVMLLILYLIEAISLLIYTEINSLFQVSFVVQIVLVGWATLILFLNLQQKKIHLS